MNFGTNFVPRYRAAPHRLAFELAFVTDDVSGPLMPRQLRQALCRFMLRYKNPRQMVAYVRSLGHAG